jgi:VIT1/CCC1 family predicted Fe2+/Mn2+ transporter
MKESYKKGLSFGLTSAVITTLGLMVGLNSSTGSKLVVISGILIIAISDAFSDALGIHVSEEANVNNKSRHVWEATIITFFSKSLFALTFLIPFLFFSLSTSVIVSIFWGAFLLIVISYKIGKNSGFSRRKISHIIMEHLFIALLVITASYYLGILVNNIVFKYL